MIHQPDLETTLAGVLGENVDDLERQSSENGSVEVLEVALESGRVLRVMVKNVGDREREAEVYTDVLARAGLGTARCLGLDREHSLLVLEHVDGVSLGEVAERGTWEAVASWLGHAHRVLEVVPRTEHLLRYDREQFEDWMANAKAAHGVVLEPLAESQGRAADVLGSVPTTVVHGAFEASNVLVDDPVAPVRVCVVDWELAGEGPGVLDLATLLAGRLEDDRDAIAASYRRSIWRDESWAADPGEFAEALAAARLQHALRRLASSQDAAPWLEEARTAAAQLAG